MPNLSVRLGNFRIAIRHFSVFALHIIIHGIPGLRQPLNEGTSNIYTVEYFISRITSMDARTEDKQPEQWLDTADVCAGLQLDRRTVYSLREQGKLPFSQFQHRVYYKAKDVKALAEGLTEKSPKNEETEIVNPSK